MDLIPERGVTYIGEVGIVIGDGGGVIVRPLDEILVGGEVYEAKGHAAMLAISQHLSFMSEFEVEFGELEAVRGGLKGSEAPAGGRAPLGSALEEDGA